MTDGTDGTDSAATIDATEIGDVEDFREALVDLLSAAEAADVSADAMVGLLTLYLAGMRGQVRLPLVMEPDRAREFKVTAEEHVGETMQIELHITRDVIDDIDLQLGAFGDEGAGNGGPTDGER